MATMVLRNQKPFCSFSGRSFTFMFRATGDTSLRFLMRKKDPSNEKPQHYLQELFLDSLSNNFLPLPVGNADWRSLNALASPFFDRLFLKLFLLSRSFPSEKKHAGERCETAS